MPEGDKFFIMWCFALLLQAHNRLVGIRGEYHLPVNALVQNMFSRDIKRLSFRFQTFKFYFPTLLKGKMILVIQQEGKKLSERRPTFNDLRNQVKELAQDYSLSEFWRRLGCSFKNR